MARISRLTVFWKAFFATLLSGTLATASTRGDTEAWTAAMTTNTADGYYLYLSLFPAGDYVQEALAALARLGAIGLPRTIVIPQVVQTSPTKTAGGPYG
jgi:hydroxymethylpyrimidine/phosphomethylpyrimidine kinase